MEAINNSPESDRFFTFSLLFSKLYKLIIEKIIYRRNGEGKYANLRSNKWSIFWCISL